MANFLSEDKLVKLRQESPDVQAQVLDKYFPTLKQEAPEIQNQVRVKYGLTTAQAQQPVSAKPNDAEGMSTLQKGVAGLGGGLEMTGRGVLQAIAKLASPIRTSMNMPQILPQMTKEGEAARTDLNRLTDQSKMASVGKFAGEMLPAMAIPGGVSGGLLKRMGTSALAGAGQGAARFTGEGESTAQNTAIGGIFGGAVPAAMAPISKAISAIQGNVAKSPINKLAEKTKVLTTLGEDTQNPHILRAESWLDRLPIIGNKGFREKQLASAEDAAKGFMAKYVRNPDEVQGALTENRNYVSGLYESVKSKMKDFSGLKAYATETSTATKELLDRFPDTFKQFPDAKIAKIALEMQEGAGKIHSFDDLWEFRKGLGGIVGQAKKQLQGGQVNETQYSQLNSIYSAVTRDMDKFTEQIGQPGIKAGLKQANDAYKNYVVKYAVLERAMDKSLNSEGKFSPLKFSSALDKIIKKEKYYGTFTKSEKSEMAGLAHILGVVKEAGQYAANPKTGAKLAEPGAIMAGLGLAKTVPYAVAAKFLSTTKAGKALAMASSKVESGSPKMQSIIDQVYKGASRMTVNESLNTLNPSQSR